MLTISSFLKDKRLNTAAITVASKSTNEWRNPTEPKLHQLRCAKWLVCWNNWNFRILCGYKSREHASM